jgi:hypothetical protein
MTRQNEGHGHMEIPNFTLDASVRLRTNFAIHHLRAAVSAARRAHKVEQANLTAEFGPWFDNMMVWVPVSVTMAGAALEAGANEAIQDILDGFTELPLTEARKALLKDLKGQRSGNAVPKYRQLALLFDKIPNQQGAAWRNATLLVTFRNCFMHFKPSWDGDNVNDGLVADLKNKLPIVPAYKQNFVFPYGFMTYGCAKWAIRTVLAFSNEFTAELGTKDMFALPHLDFTLP